MEQWLHLVNSAPDSHLHCPLEVADHQALHQKKTENNITIRSKTLTFIINTLHVSRLLCFQNKVTSYIVGRGLNKAQIGLQAWTLVPNEQSCLQG